jgi:FtsZ-interacting cell division protein YlmF
VDFLSGCAYALDGSIKKAANNVFILVPRDVGVDEDTEKQEDEA